MTDKLNFTQAALDSLPLPAAGRATYHDTKVSGLQVRVTASGTKSFSVFMRRAGHQPERITIGKYPNVSVDVARREAKKAIALLAQGESPAASKRAEDDKALTLADAMVEYLAGKKRKTGLALKPRTVDDYKAMVTPATDRTRGGYLASLANKPIRALTAADLKSLHAANLQRGERQAAYAMTVLRAVLKWHGVAIQGDPFAPGTIGRDKIELPSARASDPEPVERILRGLGGFWKALQAMPESPARDYIAFLLLTGCRAGEPRQITMGNVDLAGGNVTLRDTKNRRDHVLRLSTQALAIVERQPGGDRLFPASELLVNKAARELAEATGLVFTPKMARSVFASIAEELVSAATLKRLLNHHRVGDIADTHYVRKQEDQLRAGWQLVADHIESA